MKTLENLKSVSTAAATLLFSFSGEASAATITTFTSLSAWETAVSGTTESFLTTANNVSLANEVGSVPSNGTILGGTLTFDAATTSLSRTFTITTLQDASDFIFSDLDGANSGRFDNALDIGGGSLEDDDFQLSFDGQLSAFAIFIVGSEVTTGESFSIYDGATLLESVPIFGSGIDRFLGFVSDEGFDRVQFDEDPGFDDIMIKDIRFSNIPEPSTGLLILPAGLMILFVRRRLN